MSKQSTLCIIVAALFANALTANAEEARLPPFNMSVAERQASERVITGRAIRDRPDTVLHHVDPHLF